MEAEITNFLKTAFNEDIQDGDHSSLACIPADATKKAQLLIKEGGILAGVDLAAHIFNYTDASLQMKVFVKDGAVVQPGDVAFEVTGSAQSILSSERIVLNCMQRMSAIATKTQKFVKLIEDLETKVLDTRKTTPGLRFMEKWAVRIGGGMNHRFGLYDMIMLKDNHIDFAGGIDQAILKTNDYLKKNNKELRIEIETRNLDEVKQVLAVGGVDRIMLDNFSLDDVSSAVSMISGKFETEASGGINIDTVRQFAACGVDYVSVGAITHSINNLDLSLKAINE